MKLLFEKIFPYFFGLIALILWVQFKAEFPKTDAVLSSTLSVSSIFVGFLATSKAILISMNSQIIKDLRDSGYINELVCYIGEAIWINLFFCTISVTGYFINQSYYLYGVCWIFFSVASLMAFVRVTDIMLKIFKYNN